MDSNFWFYTLSAIPQTVASLIALSATFVVFKLNTIDSNINTDIYHIKIFLNVLNNNFEPYIRRKNIKEILQPLKKEIEKLDSKKKFLGLEEIVFNNLTSACRYIISGERVTWYPLSEQNLYKFVKYKYDSLLDGDLSKQKILDSLKKVLILSAISVTSCLFLLLNSQIFISKNYSTTFIIYFLSIFSILSIIYTIYSIFKISRTDGISALIDEKRE